GAAVWAAQMPGRRFRWLPAVPRFVARALLWVAMPLIYYYYLCRAILGRDDFRFEARDILSPRGATGFTALPESVQIGFLKPFGDHQHHAWYELTAKVSDPAKAALKDEQDGVTDVLVL